MSQNLQNDANVAGLQSVANVAELSKKMLPMVWSFQNVAETLINALNV